MANSARLVIDKVGGFRAAAEVCRIDIAQVYRWTYEKNKGGTGGLVPAKHQSKLLDFAKTTGLPLEAEDFFRTSSEAGL